MASDNFDRADETPIQSPWIKNGGSDVLLSGNAVHKTVADDAYIKYSGAAVTSDQFAQATETSSIGGHDWSPAVRVGGAGHTTPAEGYFADAGFHEMGKHVNGAFTSLGSFSWPTAYGNGQVMRLEAEGSTIRAYQDGTLAKTVTDVSLPNGLPGIFIFDTGGGIDNWSGGDLVPPGATAAGQMGWGSMGGGNMGSNFGATSSVQAGAATIASVGSVSTATVTVQRNGAATIASVGTIGTSNAQVTHNSDATIAGVGTVTTANGQATHNAAATIAGQSGITAGSSVLHPASASAAANGTVTADGIAVHNASATVAGQSGITAAATVTTTHLAAATIAATGSVTAGASREFRAAATIASVGSVSALGRRELRGAATVSGQSTFTTAVGGGGGASYSSTVLSDSPISYVRLETNSSGYAYDDILGSGYWSIINGPSLTEASLVPTESGNSYLFTTGSGQFLEAYSVMSGVSQASFEFWLKQNTGLSSFETRRIYTSLETSINIEIANNGLGGDILNFGQIDMWGEYVSVGINLSVPHHIVCVTDGLTYDVYIDGTFAGSTSANFGMTYNGAQNAWGGDNYNTFTFFDGWLDELATYDYALSPTQIAAHATAGFTGGGTGDLVRVIHNAAATRAATSGVTATATVTGTQLGAATIAGTGTVTATAQVTHPAAATVAGTGTVTAAGQAVHNAAATIAGQSGITAVAQVTTNAAATIASAGTVTAAGQAVHNALATANGVSGVTAGAQAVHNAVATVAGTGTFTANGNEVFAAACTFTGQSSVSATPDSTGFQFGAANIAATSSVATASAQVTHVGASTIASIGSITAAGLVTRLAQASIAATSTFTAGGQVTRNAQASFASTGSVTPVGSLEFRAAATVASLSTTTGAAQKTANAVASVSSAGSMSSAASLEFNVSASPTGLSGAAGTGQLILTGEALISSISDLSGHTPGNPLPAYATLRSWSTMTGKTWFLTYGFATIRERSTMTATATKVGTQAEFHALSNLVATPTVISAVARQPRRVFSGRGGVRGSRVVGGVR